MPNFMTSLWTLQLLGVLAPPSAPHPSEDLPPGWKSRKDPQSGRIYYYNSKLKITQWEPPTREEEGEDVPPPPPLPNESGSPAPAPVRRDSFARKRDEERQLYEAMEAALEELVGSLTARIKELFTGGDKSGAVELNIEKKYALQVIEWLRKRKAAGQPVPQHQVARRIVLRTDSNPEVAGNKLRVHVTQWKWLGGARRKEEKLQLKVPPSAPVAGRGLEAASLLAATPPPLPRRRSCRGHETATRHWSWRPKSG